MALQILTKLSLDENRLAEAVRRLEATPFSEAHAQFAIGTWGTIVLANRTGNSRDAISDESPGPARPTENGRNLPYLMEIVSSLFRWEHVRSVRVFSTGRTGTILPHRDSDSIPNRFTQIQISLRADALSFHSEADRVYRMEPGEVWLPDTRVPHSAGSFGKASTFSLVIDFPAGVELRHLYLDPARCTPTVPKAIGKRPPFDTETKRSVLGLSRLIHPGNFNEIVAILAKIHFFRHAAGDEMYDWLDEICRRSGDAEMIERARALRDEFLGPVTRTK